MDFFTEMKRSLESTGKQVAKKTKDFSESLQLKSKIAAEKDALETMYRSIGRQVYTARSAARSWIGTPFSAAAAEAGSRPGERRRPRKRSGRKANRRHSK